MTNLNQFHGRQGQQPEMPQQIVISLLPVKKKSSAAGHSGRVPLNIAYFIPAGVPRDPSQQKKNE